MWQVIRLKVEAPISIEQLSDVIDNISDGVQGVLTTVPCPAEQSRGSAGAGCDKRRKEPL